MGLTMIMLKNVGPSTLSPRRGPKLRCREIANRGFCTERVQRRGTISRSSSDTVFIAKLSVPLDPRAANHRHSCYSLASRGKMCKYLLHSLIEVLGVLVWIVGKAGPGLNRVEMSRLSPSRSHRINRLSIPFTTALEKVGVGEDSMGSGKQRRQLIPTRSVPWSSICLTPRPRT